MVLPPIGSTEGVSVFRSYIALLQKSRQNVGRKCHNSEMEKQTEKKKNLLDDQLIKETALGGFRICSWERDGSVASEVI